MTPRELEDRLIKFSVDIINLPDLLEPKMASKRMADQIIRSGTSSALNYGEAQSAESSRDFIHKLSICLKELRETFINLKIIQAANLCKEPETITKILIENNELISIFVKSIETSKKKNSILNR